MTRAQNVLLYVPNLIGYFRLFLLGTAFCLDLSPQLFLSCYIVQMLLDGNILSLESSFVHILMPT